MDTTKNSSNIDILLKSISESDEKAFRKFFDIYYQRLYNVALYFLKSKEWAEEAVADVFFIIWKKREDMVHIEDLNAFLYIMIKNESLHYIRRGKALMGSNQDLYTIESVADSSDPEKQMLNEEYLQIIQKAINSLPKKCREVFRLSINDRLKQREIAALLDLSIKTVELHMATAYKRIGEYVNKEYNSFSSRSSKLYSLFFLF